MQVAIADVALGDIQSAVAHQVIFDNFLDILDTQLVVLSAVSRDDIGNIAHGQLIKLCFFRHLLICLADRVENFFGIEIDLSAISFYNYHKSTSKD